MDVQNRAASLADADSSRSGWASKTEEPGALTGQKIESVLLSAKLTCLMDERLDGSVPEDLRPPKLDQPLHILHDDMERATVDIVAVHGLGANPDYAWVWHPKNNPAASSDDYPARPINWLKELLPGKLPACRVVAFNYQSGWLTDAPQKGLSCVSDRLLDSLHNLRSESDTQDRPFIFIGHSFGGIVIMQAILSNQLRSSSSDNPKIADSTAGLLFFGTPFRGTPKANHAQILATVATAFGWTEKRLLGVLRTDNDSSMGRLHEFARWMTAMSVKAVCVSETKPTNYGSRVFFGALSYLQLVVPRESAQIDGGQSISLDTDHLKLNKFYGEKDPSFQHIYPEIRSMAVDAPALLERRRNPRQLLTDGGKAEGSSLQECLRAMKVENPVDMKVKGEKGEKRVSETCEWIWSRSEFTQWAAGGQQGLLRLVGPPGVGKSMMSSFLVDTIKERVQRAPRQSFAYFFCDEKSDQQNTCVAVLRSLIWQLLSQNHVLFREHVKPDFDRYTKETVFEGLFHSTTALSRMFDGILRDARAGQVFILIDALDECRPESRPDLIRVISDLSRDNSSALRPSIKLLVTSRPNLNDIETGLGNAGVTLHLNSSTVNSDLRRYIEFKVPKLVEKKGWSDLTRVEIETLFKEQSRCSFLWISLMTKVLGNVCEHKVGEVLKGLPEALDQVYARILGDVPEQDRQDARVLLLLMTAAPRPLEKQDVQAMFACWKQQGEFEEETLDLYSDVCLSCRSILYFEQERDWWYGIRTMVTFCHQSAKDFLLHHAKENRAQHQEWYRMTETEAHCFALEILWQHRTRFGSNPGPLDPYEKEWWATHAEAGWRAFTSRMASKLRDAKSSAALDAWVLNAIRGGLVDLLRSLLSLKPKKYWIRFLGRQVGLLHSAIDSDDGGIATCKILLEYKKDLAKSLSGFGRTPLDTAARDAALSPRREQVFGTMQLLLDNKADVMARNTHGNTPLHSLCRGPYAKREMFLLFLGRGAKINAGNDSGETPLHLAARNATPEVIHCLLGRGARLDARDRSGFLPIHHASRGKSPSNVALFIKIGQDVNARQSSGYTPLHEAARSGAVSVVQFLVDQGAEINARADNGETPLHQIPGSQAFWPDECDKIKIMVENQADINAKNKAAQTALHMAASRCDISEVQLLLELGAEPAARDSSGRTPIQIASQERPHEIANLLKTWRRSNVNGDGKVLEKHEIWDSASTSTLRSEKSEGNGSLVSNKGW